MSTGVGRKVCGVCIKYGIRMKEWAKSDCRFGILVKNYIEKVTTDVSDVSDGTDVTDVTDVTNRTLRKLV